MRKKHSIPAIHADGSGAPQNPIFLAVPEPDGSLLGGIALAGVGLCALARGQAKVAG